MVDMHQMKIATFDPLCSRNGGFGVSRGERIERFTRRHDKQASLHREEKRGWDDMEETYPI
jgi:hypothetical protein